MLSRTKSTRHTSTPASRIATRRQRRAEREFYAHVAQRPQNVRNELLEMRSHPN